MKLTKLVILASLFALMVSCSNDDDKPSERFMNLTSSIWVADELLINGEDASGEGQLLENLKGDVKFNSDGTGSFGEYSGSWSFAQKETQLQIFTEAIGFIIITNIEVLTSTSLKINTAYEIGTNQVTIHMSFNAK